LKKRFSDPRKKKLNILDYKRGENEAKKVKTALFGLNE
jgi:hypothetical protein